MFAAIKKTTYFSKYLTPRNIMLGLGLYGYHEYNKYAMKVEF